MNIIAPKKTLLLLLGFVFIFSACSKQNDVGDVVEENNGISNFIAGEEEFTTFNAALNRTEIKQLFSENENYTIFAPNDNAFNHFFIQSEYENINDVPIDTLKQLLLNHVVKDIFPSENLSKGYYNTMATTLPTKENLSLYIAGEEELVLNAEAEIVREDMQVSNGMIHEINAVLKLPSIATFLNADENMGYAASAFASENTNNFNQAFVSTDSPAPFTLFVPENAAMRNFLETNAWDVINQIPPGLLSQTMKAHVVAENNLQLDNLQNGSSISCMQGNVLEFSTENGLALVNETGAQSRIGVSNIQARNGVIHIVDALVFNMLPD